MRKKNQPKKDINFALRLYKKELIVNSEHIEIYPGDLSDFVELYKIKNLGPDVVDIRWDGYNSDRRRINPGEEIVLNISPKILNNVWIGKPRRTVTSIVEAEGGK